MIELLSVLVGISAVSFPLYALFRLANINSIELNHELDNDGYIHNIGIESVKNVLTTCNDR